MSRRRTPRKQGMVHQENPQVRLVRLDEGSTETALLRRAVLEHDLPAEQLRFTGLPAQTLPDADGDPDSIPYAVVAGQGTPTEFPKARERCAGFGVLDRVLPGSLVDAPARAVLMRAFYIRPQWQGRGLGRASCSAPLLDRLVVEIAPHADRIVLCVGKANIPAQRAYRAAGFDDTGNVVPGSAGLQDVMARLLDTRDHLEPYTRHRRTENS